jgi:hypothetical protein
MVLACSSAWLQVFIDFPDKCEASCCRVHIDSPSICNADASAQIFSPDCFYSSRDLIFQHYLHLKVRQHSIYIGMPRQSSVSAHLNQN